MAKSKRTITREVERLWSARPKRLDLYLKTFKGKDKRRDHQR